MIASAPQDPPTPRALGTPAHDARDADDAPAERTRARRVRVEPSGPVLVEGPVEIVMADGTTARSDRFMVAVCTCRRSRTYPWCDTSHRAREQRSTSPEGTPRGTPEGRSAS
ncbi:CDGSH iron-sulfur domain-containing protein [Streptomyces sp. NPDC098789]|uniref:CDGSH iron-sulfur domain-containing protein n=1 Tax=Streptomyces sp. NPDC098789 TaxID=3366098 RepID=UPI0037F7B680